MPLVALELPDELGGEHVDDWTALYLAHLVHEGLIIFPYAISDVEVEGVNWPFDLSLRILIAEQLQETDQKLLCILLVEALYDLHILFHPQLECLVIQGALGVLQLEEELGDLAPVLDECLREDGEQHLKDCRDIASIGEVGESNGLLADKGRDLVAN